MHDSSRGVIGRMVFGRPALVSAVALIVAACAGGTSPSPSGAGGSPSAAASAGASTGGSAEPSGATQDCTPAGYPTGNVNISIWTGTDTTSQEIGREIVQEYQAAHPNVHIDNTPTGAVDAFNRMTVTLANSVPQPTSALSYEPLMETFIGQDFMEPLIPEALCASSHQELIDLYIPGSIDPLIRDGELMGMPAQRNAYSLLVNNDKFTEAGLTIPDDIPTTWDELAALQPTLHKTDANGRTIQKGFEFRYTSGDQWFGSQFIGMVYQAGGDILDSQGKAVLNSPAALRALENWTNNVVDPAVTNNQGPSPYQDFADELDVMAFGGPNALRFAEILNPSLAGRVSVFPLPRDTPDSEFSGMAYGFHQLVNSFASDEEKFVASHFIGFMFSDPNRWWQATGQLQPRTGWFTLPEAQASVGLDVFIEDLGDARGLPQTSEYLAIQTAIKNAIQRVVFEGADLQTSLDQAQQEYEATVG
jgi:ABC-type glycerol-3-phosphate transport system substrate-binding protein